MKRPSNAFDTSTALSTNAAFIKRKLWEYRFSEELQSVGYKDFKDSGNILKDFNNIGWVVDTEIQSFDPPELHRVEYMFQEYLKLRFNVLHAHDDERFHTFKVPLAEIEFRSG
jgi:hypothetical protein